MSTFVQLAQLDDDDCTTAPGRFSRATSMPPLSPLQPVDETREVFLSSSLTLKQVDSARQSFTVSGYINALWQCPDLEHEVLHEDYYASEYKGRTIKQGLEEAKRDSSPEPYHTVLDRPWVQREIRWAKQYNKQIITVVEKDPDRTGYFDWERAAAKYKGTEWESLFKIDAITYRREAHEAEAMMKIIFAKAHLSVGSISTAGDGTGSVALSYSPSAPQLSRRTDSADERAAGIRNQPGAWKFFLSHHQKHGGDQTQNLHNLFKQVGVTAWYDNAMVDRCEAAMEEGVKNSEFFMLVLTSAPERDNFARASSGTDSVYHHAGYIHTSNNRKFVDGFNLNLDRSYATPFNPERLFDKNSTVHFSLKSCKFYYYPVSENKGRDCAGLVKMAVEFDATLSQRLNMWHFPFDRQILMLSFSVRTGNRGGWVVCDEPKRWVDTGYDTDRDALITFLSHTAPSYRLEAPVVECGHSYQCYIRVERLYKHELRKIVLPLFLMVLISAASLGLEPEATNDRLLVPTIMVLAISGFFQVIQEAVPKQPIVTKLDTYITCCMAMVLITVLETLTVKVVLDRSRWGVDEYTAIGIPSQCGNDGELQCPRTGEIDRTASRYSLAERIDLGMQLGVLLVWVVPHIILLWFHHKAVPVRLQSNCFRRTVYRLTIPWMVVQSWKSCEEFVKQTAQSATRGQKAKARPPRSERYLTRARSTSSTGLSL